MTIGVISTAANCGSSTAAICMAHALSLAQNEGIMLTATSRGEAAADYLGFDRESRNFGQVIKLLESGVVGAEELIDYTVDIAENLHYINVCGETSSEEVKLATILRLLKIFPAEYKIIDIKQGFDQEFARSILDVCDVIVCVCTMHNGDYDILKKWIDTELWPKDKQHMLLINFYDPEISSVKAIARFAGYSERNTCKIHYSPYITKMCNKGELDTLVPAIERGDPRVLELSNDFREIVQFITSINMRIAKWGGKTV